MKDFLGNLSVGVLSFASVLVLLLLIGIIVYCIPDKHNTSLSISASDIETHGNTFDLLGVAYKSMSCSFVKMFTNSKWSHVAMLYRRPKVTSSTLSPEKNTLYVVEIIRTKRSDRDVQVQTFQNWLKRNSRFNILYLASAPPKTTNKSSNDSDPAISKSNDSDLAISKSNDLLDLISKHVDNSTKVNMNLFDWVQTLQSKPFQPTKNYIDNSKYFCTEFIVMLLQHAKIFKPQLEPSNFSPVKLLFPEPYGTRNEYTNKDFYETRPKKVLVAQKINTSSE